MNKRLYLPIILIVLGLMAIPLGLARSAPDADLGTGFTYQGRLHDDGTPANGTYSMVFRLYDDQSKSFLLGTVNINGVTVSDGLFTVELDFGSGKFNGQSRWLEIEVNGTPLSPLQNISPAPYALALPGLRTHQNGSVPNIIGGHHGNGVGVDVVGGTISGGGPTGNTSSNFHEIADDYGTIGGGNGNYAGANDGSSSDDSYATVSGGKGNFAINVATTIGGGQSNTTSGPYSTISGGFDNNADKEYDTVGGGEGNLAKGGWSTISGGQSNTTDGENSTIGGGSRNNAGAKYATIAGGGPTDAGNPTTTNNRVYDNYGTIGGGGGNIIGISNSAKFSDFATIGGGENNLAEGNRSVVSGGTGNQAIDQYTTVGGGTSNKATGYAATISGGDKNEASGPNSSIGGGGDTDGEIPGFANYATDSFSTVSGGGNNRAGNSNSSSGDARAATIGGGEGNRATNKYSTIPGGRHALANNYGQFAYASGQFSSDKSQAGDAQTSIYVLRGETTDSTQTEIFLDGHQQSERINIADGQTLAFDFLIAARSDGNQSAGYQGSGVIENYSGTVSLVGYAVTMEIEDNTAWSISISADDTNDALVIKVTGASSTDIRWVATLRTTEVTFPPSP